MTLNTDFNVAPYFDDYDETKNYHLIPFKSGKPVSARELNQLQRILQGQIERFGEAVLSRGSIIKGGNISDFRYISYVKIRDANINNQPILIVNYVGVRLVGKSSGVEAVVVTTEAGYESKSPDLNTLYVKYTKTGIDALENDVKVFLAGEVLECYKNGVHVPELDVNVVSYSIDANPLGLGYVVKCGEGIIFQKGFFINFESQTIVVQKYHNKPHEKVIGFKTVESIITHNADLSLKDNALGSPNYNAPGADRVHLEPKLVVLSLEEADEDENFLAIQQYEEGLILSRNTDTTFSKSLYSEFNKRTYEESGNYTVSGHIPYLGTAPGADTTPVVIVPKGVSYVGGKRVETISPLYLGIDGGEQNQGTISETVVKTYGNYVVVSAMWGFFDLSASVGISVIFRNATQTSAATANGVNIGNAKVDFYKYNQNGTVNVYLSNIKMETGRQFSEIRSLKFGTNCSANVLLESGKAVIKGAADHSFLYPLTNSGVSNVTNSYEFTSVRRTTATPSGGNITINLTGTEYFPYTNATLYPEQIRDFIVCTTDSQVFVPTSVVISNNRQTAVLNCSSVLGSSTTPQIITHPVNITSAYAGKSVNSYYVRYNMNGVSKTGALYLGMPDVSKIEGIYLGTDNTFTETTSGVVDITKHFDFFPNKTPYGYDTSYIKVRSTFRLLDTHRLLIKLKAFRRVTTSPYANGAYCFNSYPIDDTSTVLPANRVRSLDMSYEERNSIDVRPSIVNVAVYSTTPAGATIGSAGNLLRGSTWVYNPIDSTTTQIPAMAYGLSVDYVFDLPRLDKIVIDETGRISLLKGVHANPPIAPVVDTKSLVLGELYVPIAPIMLPNVAAKMGAENNSLRLSTKKNKRHTMRDIGNIDDRISNIEYYTVLSAQELSADNMVIKGADGLDRFKNGIFVENFDNMAACNVKSDDFSASVDSGEGVLYPKFRAYNIDLTADQIINGTLNNRTVASLNKKDVIMEQQLYATRYRNCVTDFYSFKGNGKINPEYDSGYEETVAPAMNITIDMTGAFVDYTEKLNEFMPIKTTNISKTVLTGSSATSRSTTDTDTSVSRTGNSTATTTTTTTTVTSTTTNNYKTTNTTTTSQGQLYVSGSTTTKQKVGEFITDVQFSPYLRENLVKVAFTGLRPNTRFWVWFDSVNVNTHCAPAVLDGTTMAQIKRTGKFGNPLRSNDNGELYFVYYIKKETFYVGDRDLVVMDVDSLTSVDAATSTGVVTYRGFNYSVEKTGLEVSTRVPTFDTKIETTKKSTSTTSSNTTVSTETSSNTSVDVVTTPEPTTPRTPWRLTFNRGNTGEGDPIAQTFKVDKTYTDKDAVMITRVAVAFKRKSAKYGVTLQIRKTENGYPSGEILPFASTRLPAANVKISDKGNVYTEFAFTSPVTLAVGESYAIVVIPDGNSPDYLIFCNKTGETDLITGKTIISDASTGTLFTSTNNKAWTPYQDENLVFIIKRAEFTTDIGQLFLSPQNYEFFDIDGYVGTFVRGEKLFKVNPTQGYCSTISGSKTISASGINFSTQYKVGDSLAIYNSTDNTYDVVKIVTIVNSSTITVDEYMTDSIKQRPFFKTVTANVDYFNKKDPVRLFAKNSDATSTNYFSDGDNVRGERSNATAKIGTVLNLPVSHYQPNIYATNYNLTSTSLTMYRQTNAAGSVSAPNLQQKMNDTNRLTNINTVMKSRSKEVVENGGAKSFQFRVNMKADGATPKTVSPLIDYEISSITAYEYFINPYTTEVDVSERQDDGLAEARYISKTITLKNGFDAEGLKLWLTGYKPVGTDINVFVKFKSSIDDTLDTNLPWTKMTLLDNRNFRSSTNNLNDWKEFEYTIPLVSVGGGASVSAADDFSYVDGDGGIQENFKYFTVKVILSSTTKNIIPKVKDIRAIALT